MNPGVRTPTPHHVPSQAHGLMHATRKPQAPVEHVETPTMLCSSGRGGSGTTLIAALFAMAAAGDGHRVLLIDTDDLVGPAALLLGVKPAVTWQQLRTGRVSAANVLTPVSNTLMLVAGGVTAGQDASPVSAAERRACMRRLSSITHSFDLVVIDCGARLDALSAAITPHQHERLFAVAAGSDPVALASTFALCKAARLRNASMQTDVVVNRLERSEALRCFDAVDAGARQFLGTSLSYAGAIPFDQTMDAALRAGMPFWDAAVGSPAAIAAHDVVTRMLSIASPTLSRIGA